MQQKLILGLLVFALIAQIPNVTADALFMSCPTLFNTDISNVSGNIFIGSPPSADCGPVAAIPPAGVDCNVAGEGFHLEVNGKTEDIISCKCYESNPGAWKISLSTPIKQDYNITAWILNSTPATTASYTCIVPRKTFEGGLTIPEIPIFLLPFLIFAAIFIIRKEKK